MSKQTESNLFIGSSIEKVAEFYQRLVRGITSYQELGTRVLGRIKTAYAFRQVEQVRELARILINNPIREFQVIGQYYLVWCKCREAEYQNESLERIIEQTKIYKSKGLVSRGTFELYESRPETALSFYTEALRATLTVSDYIAAARGIAAAKSMEGFHASALRDLERLIPLVSHGEPLTYYEVINSYAVELNESSRLSEAYHASLVAASSRFGPYYPEWQETLSDVRSKRKQRSTVSIPPPQECKREALEPVDDEARSPDRRVEIVIEFMNANLERKISLRNLAEVANLSPSHLSRLFKSATEMSPVEYLIRLRMEKARQLLGNSVLSVKQVMAKVGYYNKSHFAQHFRRCFHFAPSEYRENVSRLITKSNYLVRLNLKTG